jgi:glutathione synthase/RimK-type ligase-like ATP-grasp enzyme
MTPYPNQTRFVARACAALGLRFTELDNGGGYLFAVSDGAHEFVSGGGTICTYPLNGASAFGISRDKHHCNAVLAHADLPVIPGQLFFLKEEFAKLREPGRERADAIAAFARHPKPVFCKPNQGSRGDFAEIVPDDAAFQDYLGRVIGRHDSILLQPVLSGDEYRVFCLDDDAIFATRKAEFRLVGDGEKSLRQLLHDRNLAFEGTGVSMIAEEGAIALLAARHGLAGDHIPARDEAVALPGRRNLSAGSDVEDFTTAVPQQLADMALRAAKAIGLRVAGVDLFDTSPARDLSGLIVIEVNGNPAIASLESIGRDDVIDRIWQAVLARTFAKWRAP